jgi:hypothetical protein
MHVDAPRLGAMITHEEAREIALALPEVVERDHHGRPSFRVAGRIFATLWDAEHTNVMLDEDGIRSAIEAHPGTCAEVWWGRRLSAVRVDLRRVGRRQLAELYADAWEGKAPRRLVAQRTDASSAGRSRRQTSS